MESADLIDSFKAMNPSKIDFTWSNPSVSTRIDHIWIPQSYMKFLKWIQHVDSNFITQSDHKIVVCEFYMAKITRNIKKFTTRNTDSPHDTSFRQININSASITKDQWTDFNCSLQSIGDTWILVLLKVRLGPT